MRDITIRVFGFDELSQDAQDTAFENWSDDVGGRQYPWYTDNSDILEYISDNLGVKLDTWRYDAYNYQYSLADIEHITHTEALYANGSNMNELYGIRAAKVALSLYYELTEQRIAYGFYKRNSKPTKSTIKYIKNLEKYRLSAFIGVERCFTGYCASETFAAALWDSIAKNGTNSSYTVTDHLKFAFNELFDSFVADIAYSESKQAFLDAPAYEEEYLADGTVFDHTEETA